MAQFQFENREGKILTNIARAELKRRVKGTAYANMDNIKKNINEEYINQVGKDGRLRNSTKLISLTFQAFSYFDDEGEPEQIEAFPIEIATCSIQKTRNVVVTNILNETGSIKQITGQTDYKIQINGFLIGKSLFPSQVKEEELDTEYAKPTDEIEALTKILEADVSLHVESAFLEQFNITRLVVKSFSFPQDFSTKNIQEFSITAISDDPKIKLI